MQGHQGVAESDPLGSPAVGGASVPVVTPSDASHAAAVALEVMQACSYAAPRWPCAVTSDDVIERLSESVVSSLAASRPPSLHPPSLHPPSLTPDFLGEYRSFKSTP